MAYFPTLATYNCLYPASHDLIEKLGVDGFLACTYDNMWYNGCYTITMHRTGAPAQEMPEELLNCAVPAAGDYVVFAGRDVIGEGDPELGHSLIKMFFYTLSEKPDLPSAICFMNNGVRLVTENEQTIEHLKVL